MNGSATLASGIRDVGIRNTRWTVHHDMWLDQFWVYAHFRDRRGAWWVFRVAVASELVEDVPMLPLVWQLLAGNFKRQLDHRYDDPYAFWPELPGRGEGSRWL